MQSIGLGIGLGICLGFGAANVRGSDGQPAPLELSEEVVCRVNCEAVSKRQVEDRMPEIMYKLNAWRLPLVQNNQWSKELDLKWNELYIPAFRDQLRRIVRERLMIQYAEKEKVTPDEKAIKREYDDVCKRIKDSGGWGGKGFSTVDVMKRVRENVTIDHYRQKIFNILDQPTKPEIEKYYKENLTKFQRKAGVKVRYIRIDRFVTDKITGKQTVRDNSFEDAEKLRADIIAFNGSFAEVARQHSDDLLARERGGLIQLDPKDDYFDPAGYSPQLAKAIKGLKVGEVSKVFEFGQTSWAFALLEDVREAGAVPLEGELYNELDHSLVRVKQKKKEDEWFKKALSKSLVVHVVNAVPEQLSIDFFFPDEKEAKPAPAPASATAPAPDTTANAAKD